MNSLRPVMAFCYSLQTTVKSSPVLSTSTLATPVTTSSTHHQQTVWGPEYGAETEYLRTFVKQLRRKLEQDPSRPNRILTEPGVGYRLFLD
jgi:DNA-binding response OmpR family regulator